MHKYDEHDTVMLTSCSQDGKFSIWFVNYKNNDEYKKKLMAVNLIGGWFQRCVKVLSPRLRNAYAKSISEPVCVCSCVCVCFRSLVCRLDGTGTRKVAFGVTGVFGQVINIRNACKT